MNKLKTYTDRLVLHIESVREYGRGLGIDEAQLQIHDLSKWSPEEFEPYARFFVKDGSRVDDDDVPDGMVAAWLNHIHHNPHHWQYWIFPDGYNPKGSNLENGVMEMPQKYALEMVADWHGAGKAYTGSWDIQEWLIENMSRMTVHSETARYLREVLDSIGYGNVVWTQKWKHENN